MCVNLPTTLLGGIFGWRMWWWKPMGGRLCELADLNCGRGKIR
jgi:hypothetical protein